MWDFHKKRLAVEENYLQEISSSVEFKFFFAGKDMKRTFKEILNMGKVGTLAQRAKRCEGVLSFS